MLAKIGALLVLCTIVVVAAPNTEYTYQEMGTFLVDYPSFLNLGYFTQENRDAGKRSLIISSFSGAPFAVDGVYLVEDIGNLLNNFSAIVPETLTNSIVWPNEATPVPFEIFNEPAIGLGSGFLVPGKETGTVSIISSKTGTPFSISTPKSQWFYHVAEWWDMNGDGLEDCVSARATVPTIGPSQGELVWFENPGSNALSQPWEEHVISSGPDIMIHLLSLDGDEQSQPQIVAAQFFSNELTLWYTENNTLWNDENNVKHIVIDNELGSPFDVQYYDLNNDGKKDLLVTNHEGKANESAVFAYTVPQNWKTDPWPRYVLATNITTRKPGPNQASPGRASAFHPNVADVDQKPLIIVGGDGAELTFMLYPNSEDPNDWTYQRKDVMKSGCTVGQVVVGDVNGDGLVEFFIPSFEKGMVTGFSYGSF